MIGLVENELVATDYFIDPVVDIKVRVILKPIDYLTQLFFKNIWINSSFDVEHGSGSTKPNVWDSFLTCFLE
jgi:hypothetical protein